MFYVYLLKLEERGGKNFYIGCTSDLRKRITEHKKGLTRSTKGRAFDLVYYEAFNNKYLALKREKGLKQSGSVHMALMKRLGLK